MRLLTPDAHNQGRRTLIVFTTPLSTPRERIHTHRHTTTKYIPFVETAKTNNQKFLLI
jgi:hypothetical protein